MWADGRKEPRAAIFTALRDMEAGEELTISYGEFYWKSREDNPR